MVAALAAVIVSVAVLPSAAHAVPSANQQPARMVLNALPVSPERMTGYELCSRMALRGVLAKDAHGSTIRLAPPLVASVEDIDVMVEAIEDSLSV